MFGQVRGKKHLFFSFGELAFLAPCRWRMNFILIAHINFEYLSQFVMIASESWPDLAFSASFSSQAPELALALI